MGCLEGGSDLLARALSGLSLCTALSAFACSTTEPPPTPGTVEPLALMFTPDVPKAPPRVVLEESSKGEDVPFVAAEFGRSFEQKSPRRKP